MRIIKKFEQSATHLVTFEIIIRVLHVQQVEQGLAHIYGADLLWGDARSKTVCELCVKTSLPHTISWRENGKRDAPCPEHTSPRT
jgi:hypothetical protein